MRIIAIDQSLTCTGYVIAEKGHLSSFSLITSGSIHSSKLDVNDGYKDVMARANNIADTIHSLICNYEVNEIILEGLSFGSRGDATRNLAILFGVILAKAPLTFNTVAPTSLKKFATGSGRADKKEMLLAISKVEPELFEQLSSMTIKAGKYDIADAFWLAHYWNTNYAT